MAARAGRLHRNAGQQTTYDESIDLLKVVNGLAIDQNQIDPLRLPWGMKDGTAADLPARLRQGQYDLRSRQGCRLAHAWADKHAATIWSTVRRATGWMTFTHQR